MLGLTFAYASNGHGIVEFDALTGLEQTRDDFPTPEELWARRPRAAQQWLLALPYHDGGRPLRYYQEIAVNRELEVERAASFAQLCTLLWAKRDSNP